MDLLEENTVEAAVEKHVPVIEKMEGGFKVKIGAVPHPMEEEHYIEWVEVIFEDGRSCRKFLKPGDKPEADFKCDRKPIKALIYCNLHGLWTNKK
jgi:superoxide reductase